MDAAGSQECNEDSPVSGKEGHGEHSDTGRYKRPAEEATAGGRRKGSALSQTLTSRGPAGGVSRRHPREFFLVRDITLTVLAVDDDVRRKHRWDDAQLTEAAAAAFVGCGFHQKVGSCAIHSILGIRPRDHEVAYCRNIASTV